jgi:GntR family transcriptional regulator
MIPFRINFRSGVPLYEQIVYAAKKAIVSRQLRPGEAFPSVRVLSRELKINPNTAHKVITQLIGSGLLETRPGIGTVVSELPEARASERVRLLEYEIEQLVVEAKKLGIGLDEVIESVSEHWKDLSHHRSAMAGDEPNNRYREPR